MEEKNDKKAKKNEIKKTKNNKLNNRKVANEEQKKEKTLSKSNPQKNTSKLKKIFTKKNIIYLTILIFDLIIIIYAARHNIINYVNVKGKEKYMGDTKNLYFGRNYITLLTTIVVYIYIIILKKFYYHEKLTKKILSLLLILLLLINCLVFYLFTIKVY